MGTRVASPVAGRASASRKGSVVTAKTSKAEGGTVAVAPVGSADERLHAIFKAYDVRGLVGEQIDPALARAIGAAFARFVVAEEKASAVVVARDMRPSGVDLVAAFIDGATGEGVGVTDIGLASTDIMYFASGTLGVPGAMFTASHNPAAYNGIKMCLSSAKPIGDDTGLQVIRNTAADLAMGRSPFSSSAAPGERRQADMLDAFVDHALSFIDVSAIRPGLKIVADTANGMGGLVAPAVLKRLPVSFEILFPELDGTFPNHPADPIQLENLRDLQAAVVSSRADIGLAFDGDADRVFLVDEKGQPISGSTTTAMVASAMLRKHPGATVLYNCICSKAVPEVITECGGVPVRTRVGHSFIKALMAETDAVFGGEHSAHYYFRDNWRADSGIIAALHVLELLSTAEGGAPISEVRRPFERYAGSGEINTKVANPQLVIERVEAAFAARATSVDHLDGLTVDMGSWWFNLRASNTEPLLRLNLEAPTSADVGTHVADVLALIMGLASVKE
jgi:phosphomannomutase